MGCFLSLSSISNLLFCFYGVLANDWFGAITSQHIFLFTTKQISFQHFETAASDQIFIFLIDKLFVLNSQKGSRNKITAFEPSWAHGPKSYEGRGRLKRWWRYVLNVSCDSILFWKDFDRSSKPLNSQKTTIFNKRLRVSGKICIIWYQEPWRILRNGMVHYAIMLYLNNTMNYHLIIQQTTYFTLTPKYL